MHMPAVHRFPDATRVAVALKAWACHHWFAAIFLFIKSYKLNSILNIFFNILIWLKMF